MLQLRLNQKKYYKGANRNMLNVKVGVFSLPDANLKLSATLECTKKILSRPEHHKINFCTLNLRLYNNYI